jgi:hypothetical protein
MLDIRDGKPSTLYNSSRKSFFVKDLSGVFKYRVLWYYKLGTTIIINYFWTLSKMKIKNFPVKVYDPFGFFW